MPINLLARKRCAATAQLIKTAIAIVMAVSLCSGAALAQGSRFDGIAQSTTVVGGSTVVVPLPGATITVCSHPATGQTSITPCTNKVTTYTDVTLATPCPTTTQVVLAGTSSCVAATDPQGNYGIWVPAGGYDYSICASGVCSTPNYAYVGLQPTNATSNTFLGTNNFKTLNGCQYVDGTLYTTIQSAITAASTNGCVIIRSDYAGNDNFTNPNGIVIYDLRGVASKNKALSVKDFGAKGDLQQEGGDNENTGHGAITAGQTTLTDNSATFTSNDCVSPGVGCTGPANKLIVVYGAGIAWPARAPSTAVSAGSLVYQKITINSIPNVAVAFYARIGGTTGAGAVIWPTQWAGPPGLVLHSAGEVVDGTVTWDMIGSAPVAFTQAFTTAMPLVTTITGFTNSHVVTLAAAAGTTMTTAKVQWATDDTAAINSAISRACSLVTSSLSTYGNYVVAFPRGGYGTSSTIVAPNCVPQSGMTLVGDGSAAGEGQQAGSYLWNTNLNADGIQYTLSPLSFLSQGVGVIGLGGGYGTGQGIVVGSATSPAFEGGIFNAWVANNPSINIREENTQRFIVAIDNVGGSETAVFLNGGQAGSASPCGQTNQPQLGPNLKFFAAGGPDILILNVHWFKIQGSAYGPAQGNRLADPTIGAVQIEADASGSSGVGSCTYGGNVEGTFFNNGNDIYATGPAGFHPSNIWLSGISTNPTQSVVKLANADNFNVGPFQVYQPGGCFINATNCTNVGAPVIDIEGTSDSNYIHDVSDSYVVNPPYNPSFGIELGATTTNNKIGVNGAKGTSSNLHVEPGATFAVVDSGAQRLQTLAVQTSSVLGDGTTAGNLFQKVNTPAANQAGFEIDKAGVQKWLIYDDASSSDLSFFNGTATLAKLLSTGNWQGSLFSTITNCAVNSVSPAACGSAASGAFVVPTTTTTYTVNTTAVTAASRIILQPRTYAGDLPSTPTCTAVAVTSSVDISAVSAGTSFTFILPSTAGQTCWNYWIVN